ncbi:TMF-regulated nuclear protein 1 [Crotalus adamanteus]|uniref:TMF-regulated nuclear protein 1 n=1 Tax=Crotalus adamanteus TaxID=8729 RepID=A0AAW1AXP2_CROAD
MPGCGAAPPAVGALRAPRGVEEAAKPAEVAAAAAPPASSQELELAEARRRLLEAEGRRHLVSELETRVQHLHRVFLEAELRMATRAETVGRLGSGVAQAELHLTAHGQRLKKSARRYKTRPPALLASALALSSCVPWAACRMRRGGGPEPPESPRSPYPARSSGRAAAPLLERPRRAAAGQGRTRSAQELGGRRDRGRIPTGRGKGRLVEVGTVRRQLFLPSMRVTLAALTGGRSSAHLPRTGFRPAC